MISGKIGKIILAAIILLALLLLPLTSFTQAVIMRAAIAAIMAVGLNITAGLSGQISMGQAMFMAAGAYTVGLISARLPLPYLLLGAAGGILAAVLLSLFLSLLLVKLSGNFLSVATLGFGEIMIVVLNNCKALGGVGGLYGIDRFTTPALSFLSLLICIGIFSRYKKSRLGLITRAVRDDPLAALGCGISVKKVRVGAFVCGAAICGLAGVLYSGTVGFISPKDFGFTRCIDTLAAVAIGGFGSVWGPVIAAVALESLSLLLQPVAEYRMIIYALLLIIMAVVKYGNKQGEKE